mmetsp:Transcript_74085/g.239821  ORF Transcript_74085/g.239821 Transcript_74085/m.239821 type:complete len:100 (+) Transcript_74085:361-660(+)
MKPQTLRSRGTWVRENLAPAMEWFRFHGVFYKIESAYGRHGVANEHVAMMLRNIRCPGSGAFYCTMAWLSTSCASTTSLAGRGCRRSSSKLVVGTYLRP